MGSLVLRGEGEGRTPRLGKRAWELSAKSWGRGGASESGGQTGSGHGPDPEGRLERAEYA